MNTTGWMTTPSGHRGTVSYSGVDRCYHGHVLGIRDMITYESDNLAGCRDALIATVEDYILYMTGSDLVNSTTGTGSP